MAKIVLGAATSHSPLLTLEGADWHNRSAADRKNPNLTLADGQRVDYEALVALRGEPYGGEATRENFERIADRCQSHLDRIAADIAEARPDVIVIIGDDQDELYSPGNMPAIALYWGAQVVTHSIEDDLPAWLQTVAEGYGMDETHIFPGHPELALDLIKSLMDQDVDLAIADKVINPKTAGFGHAFGFPAERLFGGRAIPMIPVLLNTYFPPNVMTPQRCWSVGTKLRHAIEASPLDLRVAILASGGLSHFVVEEELDREVMLGIGEPDGARLCNLPRCALLEGTSEVLNWVMTAGAVSDLALAWAEYEPVRRTPAGTGIGCGFAVWKPS
ncbi:hypothetical protein ABIC78_003987 [Novosphingobium sp. 1529]|uniref:DODA-type extradiol aromatic ring-opening family dioxygenase n=1 Tax=Novosphingobium sp. 1529 TaxID=3156424 RepID=UPI003398E641